MISNPLPFTATFTLQRQCTAENQRHSSHWFLPSEFWVFWPKELWWFFVAIDHWSVCFHILNSSYSSVNAIMPSCICSNWLQKHADTASLHNFNFVKCVNLEPSWYRTQPPWVRWRTSCFRSLRTCRWFSMCRSPNGYLLRLGVRVRR